MVGDQANGWKLHPLARIWHREAGALLVNLGGPIAGGFWLPNSDPRYAHLAELGRGNCVKSEGEGADQWAAMREDGMLIPADVVARISSTRLSRLVIHWDATGPLTPMGRTAIENLRRCFLGLGVWPAAVTIRVLGGSEVPDDVFIDLRKCIGDQSVDPQLEWLPDRHVKTITVHAEPLVLPVLRVSSLAEACDFLRVETMTRALLRWSSV